AGLLPQAPGPRRAAGRRRGTGSCAPGLARRPGRLARDRQLARSRRGRKGGSMRNHRGFTLVELLVVLAIVAILAAIAYPGYARHVVKARRIEAQLALVDAMGRQEQYRALHHSYVAFSAASTD